MTREFNKALSEWIRDWKENNLSSDIRTLIRQANFDLYAGPLEEDGYPGFVSACNKIRKILDDLPSIIYFNVDTGEIIDRELECGGENDYWQEIVKSQILGVLVGKELARYI
jgi:hypothetical protein